MSAPRESQIAAAAAGIDAALDGIDDRAAVVDRAAATRALSLLAAASKRLKAKMDRTQQAIRSGDDPMGAAVTAIRLYNDAQDLRRDAKEQAGAAIVAAIEAGGKYRQIAEAVGISAAYVAKIANEHRTGTK